MVAGHENSLNNRFLPFSNIKTEAVAQIDDDICATKEDLEFGFRYALSEDPIKFCTKQMGPVVVMYSIQATLRILDLNSL